MILLVVYLLGVVFSYGLIYGSLVNTKHWNPLLIQRKYHWSFALLMSLFSWIGIPVHLFYIWDLCDGISFKWGVSGR